MPMLSRALSPLWFISALSWPARAWGQMTPADPADVGTIEDIVHAYYDVINGPSGVAKAPPLGRGVNYLLLFWDGTRWWISSAVWDDERPGGRIPESWIGRREQVP
jgi:hypothetical protein